MPIGNRPVAQKQKTNPFSALMALMGGPLGKLILSALLKDKEGEEDTGIGNEWVGGETEPRPTNVPQIPDLKLPPQSGVRNLDPIMPPAPPIQGAAKQQQDAVMKMIMAMLSKGGRL